MRLMKLLSLQIKTLFPSQRLQKDSFMNSNRNITLSDALCEATHQAMNENKNIFVIGEGVTDPKAIFGTTKNLYKTFGKKRVLDMPVSEAGLTGIIIGAAINGMKPILMHQRVDFMLLTMDQIVNSAAKLSYIFNFSSIERVVTPTLTPLKLLRESSFRYFTDLLCLFMYSGLK